MSFSNPFDEAVRNLEVISPPMSSEHSPSSAGPRELYPSVILDTFVPFEKANRRFFEHNCRMFVLL